MDVALPRPDAFTFASSTASSVSNFAFDKTEVRVY
jgi:hypothetical protein